MRAYYDIDQQMFITNPGILQGVLEFDFKRNPTASLSISFCSGSVVIELPSDAVGIFGMKVPGKYDAGYTVFAPTWVKSGSGVNTVYTFALVLINSALDGLFNVDSNTDNDVAQVSLMGELQYTTGGVIYKSPTLTINIANDVDRASSSTPPPAAPSELFAPFLTGLIALTGGISGESPVIHLDAVPTLAYVTGQIVNLVLTIGSNRQRQTFELELDSTYTYDATDPGQIRPLDWNSVSNARHWTRIG